MADQLANGLSIRTLNILDDFNREGLSMKLGIDIQYIQPGKPLQNAYIELHNRTVRHEWLDQNIFETIEDAQEQATEWLLTYNKVLLYLTNPSPKKAYNLF